MQEKDFVFKVPKAKRPHSRLYCTESYSDLDEIWNAPLHSPQTRKEKCAGSVVNSKSTESLQIKSKRSGVRRSLKLDGLPVPLITQKNKPKDKGLVVDRPLCTPSDFPEHNCVTDTGFQFPFDSLLSHNSEEDEWFSHTQDQYIHGLLKEISNNSTSRRSDMETADVEHASSADQDHAVPLFSISTQNTHFPASNQRVQDISTSHCIKTDWSPNPQHDVLIVRDESMANADSDSAGSDLDWDSLTPPTPRSPSDHTVPDLADADMNMHASDFLLYTFPIRPMHHVSETRDFSQITSSSGPSQQRQSRNTGSDHVVPEFYI